MPRDTDADWDVIATHQPFFGVLANEQYFMQNLTPDAKQDFYASGEADINHVVRTLAAINGVLFGAVHLPDVELTVLTSVGGAVWSWYYLRDRCLAPIAVSHAVLGTTYYYWIRGDDLLLRWFSATRW